MHDDSFSPMGARESRKIDDLLTKTRKIMHNYTYYAKIEKSDVLRNAARDSPHARGVPPARTS